MISSQACAIASRFSSLSTPSSAVGQCRGLLDERERVDEVREVAQRDSGDREVLDGAQRLHAEVRAARNLAVAEQVAFRARREQRPRSAHAERRVRQQPDTVGESLADACHDAVVGLRVLLADEIHCLAGDHPHRAPVRVRALAKCAVLPRIAPSETIDPSPRV